MTFWARVGEWCLGGGLSATGSLGRGVDWSSQLEQLQLRPAQRMPPLSNKPPHWSKVKLGRNGFQKRIQIILERKSAKKKYKNTAGAVAVAAQRMPPLSKSNPPAPHPADTLEQGEAGQKVENSFQ